MAAVSMTALTPAGRRWAERNQRLSLVANVALHGTSGEWPKNFIDAARQTANTEAEGSVLR